MNWEDVLTRPVARSASVEGRTRPTLKVDPSHAAPVDPPAGGHVRSDAEARPVEQPARVQLKEQVMG